MKNLFGLLSLCFDRFFSLFRKRKLNKDSRYKYLNWGLGIDGPFFFSKKFSIENNSITILGTQITHDQKWPVKYSIVKLSKFGTSIQYFDSVIFHGNQSDKEFKHTFIVPSGTDYQLEVFNYCRYITTGKFHVIQNEESKHSN
jgi:hypothetical protein